MKNGKAGIEKMILQTEAGSSTDEFNAITNLYTHGRYAEAAQLAQSMTMRFPLQGLSWMMLGLIFLQMGSNKDALLPMKNAAALSPDNPEAHNNLGVVLRSLGRLDESEASCRRALQLKPDYAEACCNLGMTLHQLGRFDESEQFHRQAVLLDADSVVCRFNLANFLAVSNRSEDLEEAKTIFLGIWGDGTILDVFFLKPDTLLLHVRLTLPLSLITRMKPWRM
jgi:Flp pilus assembly protein TadD